MSSTVEIMCNNCGAWWSTTPEAIAKCWPHFVKDGWVTVSFADRKLHLCPRCWVAARDALGALPPYENRSDIPGIPWEGRDHHFAIAGNVQGQSAPLKTTVSHEIQSAEIARNLANPPIGSLLYALDRIRIAAKNNLSWVTDYLQSGVPTELSNMGFHVRSDNGRITVGWAEKEETA